jgi:hypothetical protein
MKEFGRTGWHSYLSRQSCSPIMSTLQQFPIAILSAETAKTLSAMVTSQGDIAAYSLSFIPYSSCIMFRHRPKGRSLSKAASSASALFHFSRRAGQVMR